MSALEKLLSLSRPAASAEDPAAELVIALSSALNGLCVYLAGSDSDDDGDDDSGGKGDSDDDSGHSDHGTYKALIKKGVKPKLAAKMCARSDKKVAASALAESASVILASLTEPAMVPEQPATYLGRMVALTAPPGESPAARRVAAKPEIAQVEAALVALAAKGMSATPAVAHEPFHGVHSHAHVHSGDNMHGGTSDRVSGHGWLSFRSGSFTCERLAQQHLPGLAGCCCRRARVRRGAGPAVCVRPGPQVPG